MSSPNTPILIGENVPPPPPPPPLPQKVKEKEKPTDDNLFKNFKPVEISWGHDYPELQRACYFAKICLSRPPVECKFKEFPWILQEGKSLILKYI